MHERQYLQKQIRRRRREELKKDISEHYPEIKRLRLKEHWGWDRISERWPGQGVVCRVVVCVPSPKAVETRHHPPWANTRIGYRASVDNKL